MKRTDASSRDGRRRPRPARTEHRSGDLRKTEIADAALKVIAEQGLGRFTALAIAREVGLSDAALFRHFSDKQAIVLGAVERVEQLLFAEFPPSGTDPLEKLERFFLGRIAVIRANPGLARVIFSDQLEQAGPPDATERILRLKLVSVHFIRSCIRTAARQRVLAPGLAPEDATALVVGALMALTQSRSLTGAGPVGPARAKRLWRTLEGILRGGAGRPPGSL